MVSAFFIVVFAVFLLLLFTGFLVFKGSPRVIDPDAWVNSLPVLYVRGLVWACVKVQGVIPPDAGWEVEEGKVLMPKEKREELSAVLKGWR